MLKNKPTKSLITRNFEALVEPTGNIYETTAIIAKRAKQIASNLKEELNEKLLEFSSSEETLEEVFENQDQIDLSRRYEKMPKPINIAIEEFLSDELMHYYPQEEVEMTRPDRK